MSRIQVLGRRERLDQVLDALQRLRVLHVEDVSALPAAGVTAADGEEPAEREGRLRTLLQRLDEVLALAPVVADDGGAVPAEDEVRAELDRLGPRIDGLRARRAALAAQQASLPRYAAALAALLPLAPELSELSDQDLRRLRMATVAVVLDSRDPAVVDALRDDLLGQVGDRFDMTVARLDERTVGCVVLCAHADAQAVHEALTAEHVTHLALPPEYRTMTLRGVVAAMRSRLAALPGLVAEVDRELAELLARHGGGWWAARQQLAFELEKLAVIRRLGVTRRAFLVVGWIPKRRLGAVREELDRRIGSEVVVETVAPDWGGAGGTWPPVLLRNRRPVRPYESLVCFFALPRAGSLDPTTLIALVLPFLFGVMVGDVGYGVLLLAAGWWIRRRFARSPVVRDLGAVLLAGAVWATLFGVLFGELFGSLGHMLGMPALWFYRGGPEAVVPLLLFALGVGAAHITLGLLLGVWQSWRDRHTRALLDRAGTLLVLAGLFVVAGVAAWELPGHVLPPGIAAVVVGMVLVATPHGPLAMLELFGVLGNVISYVRVAAVGLASVYLAAVANELAVAAPLWVGIVIATFFHALNLLLAGFSPMIQSVRLHYVEFFSKFFEDGGEPYRPFGTGHPTGAPPLHAPVAVGVGAPRPASRAAAQPSGRAAASILTP
jgi:V/A-type H+-transporting ATPase subunit I